MVIEKDIIFYFSGTGNSLQVAKDIQYKINNIELLNMASVVNEEKLEIKSSLIGIVFPVYYARLPLIVEKLVKKLKISEETYVFAIATYAGAPAEVLIKLEKILQSNGKKLNSGFLIRMPGNNIFAFDANSVKWQNKCFEKEERKVEQICHIIREKRNYKCERSNLVIDILFDRISIKVTDKIMNKLPMRDKAFWVNENCIECKLCEKICPVNNIKFNSNKPTWTHNCEQCAACIQYCPKEAIQWGKKTVKRRRYRNPNLKINEL